jgi:ribosomal protein L16 Arg81 hydroxylase
MQPANANLTLVGADRDAGLANPSGFHETANLQSLVSPVSVEEFRAHYWEQKPLIVHRQQPDYYGDLFTLQDFDGSVRGAATGYIKTAEASTKKSAIHRGATPSALENVLTDMRDGHTLILDAVHRYDAKLSQMCRMLGRESGFLHQTNIYLTPPNGKGFTPHWDNHDVFIMQVLGCKHWKVEKSRRTLPQKGTNIEEEGRELRGEIYDFTLEQGDTVYIPRGFVHAAECGAESSMHITLGIFPTSWDDLLYAAVKATILQGDDLRLALPIGYHQGDGTGIVRRIEDVLRNAANPAFLAQVLDQFRDEFVQKAPLDIAGQITSFFQPQPLTLDDRVGPRAGLFYTIRPHTETVTLNVGTRSVTFPDFFGEALKFALETPSFAIRDLPGDLEDEERIVFIERLMQEALVVRT